MVSNIIAILPAWNEEKFISPVLGSLKLAVKEGVIKDFIVVANGCTDNTVGIARKAGAKVIVNKVPSKGRALISGFRWAHKRGAGVVVTVDADAEAFKPRQLLEVAAGVLNGKTLMSIAGAYSIGVMAEVPREYCGFRAISMQALKPIILGNTEWIRAISYGKYGAEVALNEKIFGKKYVHQRLMPSEAITSTTFGVTRQVRHAGTVLKDINTVAGRTTARQTLATNLRRAPRQRQFKFMKR
jgi:glycosyltransferase involved in cell wall biosynthesis